MALKNYAQNPGVSSSSYFTDASGVLSSGHGENASAVPSAELIDGSLDAASVITVLDELRQGNPSRTHQPGDFTYVHQTDLGSAKEVSEFTLTKPFPGVGSRPRLVILEGSSNESTWDSLYSDGSVDPGTWPTGAVKTFTVSSPGSYRYYRVRLGDGHLSTPGLPEGDSSLDSIEVSEIELFGAGGSLDLGGTDAGAFPKASVVTITLAAADLASNYSSEIAANAPEGNFADSADWKSIVYTYENATGQRMVVRYFNDGSGFNTESKVQLDSHVSSGALSVKTIVITDKAGDTLVLKGDDLSTDDDLIVAS